MTRRNTIVLSVLTMLAVIAFASFGCRTECQSGAICGGRNVVSPTTVTTTTVTNPSSSPSPSATPGCIAQTAPYVCSKGTSVFIPTVEAVEREIPASALPIFVDALVTALNKRPDVCAIVGPSPDEIQIKARASNAISEIIDVVRADGAIQAIPAAPSNLCLPAAF